MKTWMKRIFRIVSWGACNFSKGRGSSFVWFTINPSVRPVGQLSAVTFIFRVVDVTRFRWAIPDSMCRVTDSICIGINVRPCRQAMLHGWLVPGCSGQRCMGPSGRRRRRRNTHTHAPPVLTIIATNNRLSILISTYCLHSINYH